MYIQVIQLQETEGAPEVADSGGPPAMGRWSGGASPPLYVFNQSIAQSINEINHKQSFI